jgi:hypothetical protein
MRVILKVRSSSGDPLPVLSRDISAAYLPAVSQRPYSEADKVSVFVPDPLQPDPTVVQMIAIIAREPVMFLITEKILIMVVLRRDAFLWNKDV